MANKCVHWMARGLRPSPPVTQNVRRLRMTKLLSNEDESMMKKILCETPEEAIRRIIYWQNRTEQKWRKFSPNQPLNSEREKVGLKPV